MDTKLKNTNKIKGIIAFILSVLFVFISGFSLCCSVRDSFFYNRSEATGDYPGFENTNAFRNALYHFEDRAFSDGELLSCKNLDDYYKTAAGKELLRTVERNTEKIKAACDYLDGIKELEVSVTKDNYYRYHYKSAQGDYYYTYNGELISKENYESFDYAGIYNGTGEVYEDVCEDVSIPDEAIPTTMADIEEEEESEAQFTTAPAGFYDAADDGPVFTKNKINNIKDAIGVIWNITDNVGQGINYGEMPSEKIVEEYRSKSLPKEGGFPAYTDFSDYSSYLPGIKYAIFYKSTGRVLTNCGVTAKDDTEAVLKKLGGGFYEYFADGKYVCSGSETTVSSYDDVIDFPDSPVKIADSYEGIEKAYFGVNTGRLASADSLFISKRAYDSNISSHAKIGGNAALLAISVISFVLACACSVYTLVKTGSLPGGGAKINFTDKIPLIIRIGLAGALTAACGALVFGIHYYEYYTTDLFYHHAFPHALANHIAGGSSLICAVLIALAFASLLLLIASCVRNIKTKTFFRYTLAGYIFRLLRLVFRGIRGIHAKIKTALTRSFADDYANGRGRKFLRFSVISIAAMLLIAIILFVCADAHEGAAGFGIFCSILLALYALLLAFSFNRIASGVSKIKGGNLETFIDTRLMPPFMRAVAQDIAGVREGVQAAAEKAMKEQATRTELLTNVTHDLKTPLTSIINYVDLLKKTDDPAEQAEYLGILDDKSQRLKKLIDDLVQASKAASGNVEVNPVKLNLCEFASQIIGENEDELRDEGIELVLKLPDEPVFVYGDMNITNRIFENLLSNIRKYAMKGTRAYIEVTSGERFGLISFKNISAAPLETDTEKFTERFYRGDVSRTGDGNGLGLSIASNLCSAQGGILKIETDGDLFKAKVTIPAAASAGKED